jgi:hypothetical protein
MTQLKSTLNNNMKNWLESDQKSLASLTSKSSIKQKINGQINLA